MDKDEVRYTKGDYKRLSNRIRTNPKEISNEDYEMLQALRLTYFYRIACNLLIINMCHKPWINAGGCRCADLR